jgi:hypothetical protein
MDNAINDLFHAIALDWAEWKSRGEYAGPNDYDEFLEKLHVEEGRKYLKIIKSDDAQQTVWGFVVKEDDKKFKAGDILKAASWASPARNQARGNILDGGYSIRWTGPNYL